MGYNTIHSNMLCPLYGVSFVRGLLYMGKLGSKQMNVPISVMTRRGMERHDSGMGGMSLFIS